MGASPLRPLGGCVRLGIAADRLFIAPTRRVIHSSISRPANQQASNMLRRSVLLLASSALTPCIATPAAPPAGSFGFDWLRPGTARCGVINETALKGFRSCEYRADGTFGLRDPAFACRRNEKSEYLVYASKAACVRNLETMKANAP